ncbi:MAG: hypothetical protein ACOZCO_01030 [Bacteroidota bacterium]
MKKIITIAILMILISGCNTSRYYFRQRIPVQQETEVKNTVNEMTKSDRKDSIIPVFSDSVFIASTEREDVRHKTNAEKKTITHEMVNPKKENSKKETIVTANKSEKTIHVDRITKTPLASSAIKKPSVIKSKNSGFWEDFANGVVSVIKWIAITGLILGIIFLFTGSWVEALVILGLVLAVIFAFFLGIALVIGGLIDIIIGVHNTRSRKNNLMSKIKSSVKNISDDEENMLLGLVAGAAILFIYAIGLGGILELLMALGSVLAGLFLIGCLVAWIFKDHNFFWTMKSKKPAPFLKNLKNKLRFSNAKSDGGQIFLDTLYVLALLGLLFISSASWAEFIGMLLGVVIGAAVFCLILWLLFHNFVDDMRSYRNRR